MIKLIAIIIAVTALLTPQQAPAAPSLDILEANNTQLEVCQRANVQLIEIVQKDIAHMNEFVGKMNFYGQKIVDGSLTDEREMIAELIKLVEFTYDFKTEYYQMLTEYYLKYKDSSAVGSP